MGRRDELIAKYKEQLESVGVGVDDDLLKKVTIGCGPAIYKNDAERVSANDPAEIALVKNNFLIKKLGLSDSGDLDSAIQETVEKLGTSNKNKFRAAFYYILVKRFNKESIYG